MEYIITNADDFGISHEVNLGIVEGFRRGILHRTTLMVNMPFADEAVSLAQENNFFNKVGLHLNLTEGESLTKEIRQISWLYRGGYLTDQIIPYLRKHWLLKNTDRDCLFKEMKAQFEKYESYGLSLRHMDSHQHIHNEYVICKMAIELGVRYNFKSMRIARNLMSMTGWKQKAKKLYKDFINHSIHSRFASSNYFGSYSDFLQYFQGEGEGEVEIMLHPYLKENKLYDIVDGHLVSMDKYKF